MSKLSTTEASIFSNLKLLLSHFFTSGGNLTGYVNICYRKVIKIKEKLLILRINHFCNYYQHSFFLSIGFPEIKTYFMNKSTLTIWLSHILNAIIQQIHIFHVCIPLKDMCFTSIPIGNLCISFLLL